MVPDVLIIVEGDVDITKKVEYGDKDEKGRRIRVWNMQKERIG